MFADLGSEMKAKNLSHMQQMTQQRKSMLIAHNDMNFLNTNVQIDNTSLY